MKFAYIFWGIKLQQNEEIYRFIYNDYTIDADDQKREHNQVV